MFGRLRPPPSPPDSLERYPAKIIKDDPLSVYESTLLKLKQGARLDTCSSETECENLSSSSNSVQTSDICSSVCSDTQRDTHDAMAIDSASGQCESSKQLKKKNSSVLSMFCRYKNLAQARNSSHTVDTVKETENDL